MTKKSLNRHKRDKSNQALAAKETEQQKKIEKFKQENKAWDELHRIYFIQQDRLTTMSSHATIFFATPDLPLLLEPTTAQYTCDLIRGFAADLRIFQDRLLSLYNTHKDKTGNIDIEEDEGAYTTMVQLISSYNDFQADVDLILDPIYQQLLAVAQTIEDKARATLAAAAQAEQESTPVSTEQSA